MAFIPRLNSSGMLNNPKWYSENVFYNAGYGLPNCTCYAWGRFWEESNDDWSSMNRKPTNLPTGDGGQWWQQNLDSGAYESGQIPKLGAVICFSDNYGGAGHVAIVEQIDPNGNLTTSNSAYGGTYFWTDTVVNVGGTYNWSHYTCQGFIYNPYTDSPVPPTPTEHKKRKFPWVIFTRPIRNRRLTNF